MPEAPLDPRTGLALSGGGFRATLFHCGALIRLNELGLLKGIGRIASVSGGSIASGRLAVAWHRLTFDAGTGVATNLDAEVIRPLRDFCRQNLDVRVIGFGLIPFTRSAPERLIEAYDALLEGMTLDQLPEKPDFIFQSTNLQTGRAFRFSRRWLADYMVGEIRDTSKFRVAQAVAASSAFPPVLSPVTIKVAKSDWTDMPGTQFFGQDAYMTELNLTDGGSYDNLGLERIDRFQSVLSSDAGKPFVYGPTFGLQSLKQVLRALDIAMDQAHGLRTRYLFQQSETTGQTICYWGLAQGATDDPAPGLIPRSPEIVGEIAALRTRLNRFSDLEQGRLINWGYATCDERVRTYVLPEAPPPSALPVPDFPLA